MSFSVLERMKKMLSNLFFALAEEGNQGGGSILPMIILLVIMFVVMYFVTIRPSKKQDEEVRKMRESLQVGDEITTIGGIIGRVVSIKDETCVIETSRDCTKIRILKSAVKSIDVPVEAYKPKPEEKPVDAEPQKTENTEESKPEGDGKKSKKKKK